MARSLSCCWGAQRPGGGSSAPAPEGSLDLAALSPGAPGLLRVHGSSGNGSLGVPVTGGHDVDGDGNRDVALAAMRADPRGRTDAGEVFLVFGDGTTTEVVDTRGTSARILWIEGAAAAENAGAEIWMDDLTGDGVAELIVARQIYTGPGTDRCRCGHDSYRWCSPRAARRLGADGGRDRRRRG